jgi:hypothetical protein
VKILDEPKELESPGEAQPAQVEFGFLSMNDLAAMTSQVRESFREEKEFFECVEADGEVFYSKNRAEDVGKPWS